MAGSSHCYRRNSGSLHMWYYTCILDKLRNEIQPTDCHQIVKQPGKVRRLNDATPRTSRKVAPHTRGVSKPSLRLAARVFTPPPCLGSWNISGCGYPSDRVLARAHRLRKFQAKLTQRDSRNRHVVCSTSSFAPAHKCSRFSRG